MALKKFMTGFTTPIVSSRQFECQAKQKTPHKRGFIVFLEVLASRR